MKLKKIKYIILCLFLGTLLLQAEDNTTTDNNTSTTRIMPLGDSITFDQTYGDQRAHSQRTGYRSHLYYKLQAANYPVDFVGSQTAGQSVNPPFDPHNEGHPGWDSYEIAEKTYTYMTKSKPDLVLLHIGTNDRGSTSPAGVESILNQINIYEENNNKKVDVIVALIIDSKEPDGRVKIFNRRLNELVVTRIINGDNISLVNMYDAAGLTSSDYADRLHPNNSGYIKMANKWFDVIINPHKKSLYSFPYTISNPSYVDSINVSGQNNTVEFIAYIPNSGITF